MLIFIYKIPKCLHEQGLDKFIVSLGYKASAGHRLLLSLGWICTWLLRLPEHSGFDYQVVWRELALILNWILINHLSSSNPADIKYKLRLLSVYCFRKSIEILELMSVLRCLDAIWLPVLWKRGAYWRWKISVINSCSRTTHVHILMFCLGMH